MAALVPLSRGLQPQGVDVLVARSDEAAVRRLVADVDESATLRSATSGPAP